MASGLCEAPCWMVVVEHIAVERTASVVVVSKCSPRLLHCATLPVACGVASASQGWLPYVSRSIAFLVQAYLSIGIRFFQKPAFKIKSSDFKSPVSVQECEEDSQLVRRPAAPRDSLLLDALPSQLATEKG